MRIALAHLGIALLAACGRSPTDGSSGSLPPAGAALHVHGNQLVDSSGQVVRLRGVDRSGAEYACAQGWGFFDGPADSASVQAIASWHANAVRVPLNESCWLGINGVAPAYAGDNYRQAISDFVTLLNKAGLYVILDLHWSAADTQKALGQAPMPNRDHSPEFWREVASAFKGNDRVLFDLFNEPFPDNNADTPEAWRCWHSGGTCQGMAFQAASMQDLVDAVRSTGATNVIMLGGVQYASSLTGWQANKPTDPLNNLAASWHIYNFSWCTTQSCWDSNAAPVAQQVPLILGELGQDDGGSAFVTALMDWMDAKGGSYLAWDWDVWGQSLDLISSYDGTPTTYGETFKARFAAAAQVFSLWSRRSAYRVANR
ncbi:MAG TPA: glycoside hydrolase family 5 protein [Gemmatimonadales bacterium]|nr:glycoside hydrolase family 5 protein [Gemmatimonadales bacterium]